MRSWHDDAPTAATFIKKKIITSGWQNFNCAILRRQNAFQRPHSMFPKLNFRSWQVLDKCLTFAFAFYQCEYGLAIRYSCFRRMHEAHPEFVSRVFSEVGKLYPHIYRHTDSHSHYYYISPHTVCICDAKASWDWRIFCSCCQEYPILGKELPRNENLVRT